MLQLWKAVLLILLLWQQRNIYLQPQLIFHCPGIYTIKAWVKRTGDTQVLDDTTTVTIKHLPNALITLPVFDGFENALVKDYLLNTTGLDSNDRVDFKTNTTRGRARTFVNTGFALNGNRAITLDQFPYNAAQTTDSLLMTYNLVIISAASSYG